jgi:hypothetical protein
LFQLIFSHRTLLNQPKPTGFSTNRTSPLIAIRQVWLREPKEEEEASVISDQEQRKMR